MKHSYITLAAVIALMLCGQFAVASSAEGPYMLVRAQTTPEVKILPLLELGLDIVGGIKEQYLEVVCHPEDLTQLRSLGYKTEVLIADMERFYGAQYLTDTMGGFHTWAEAIQEINQVHIDHPNITTAPFSIGQTIEGREMYVIKISDNPEINEDEAEVFFNGLVHAREPICVEIILELIKRLTDRYGTDSLMTYLVNNRETYFMPVFNVDGYVYNQQLSPQGGGMWRKNRRLNAGGSYGVDLNRNFGFNWGYNNIGSSGTPSSETYRGTAPFSEPETENVRQFCNAHNFAITLNLHSYQNQMLYSWSIPPPAWGYTPDDATFEALTQTMQQWNGYEYGPPWEILYEVNGDANDWMYGEQGEKPKILAWVFEVGSTGFWPPQSQIPGLVEENMQPCFYLMDQAADYMPAPVMLAYIGGVINDSTGNNNGGLDPGESVLFTPTLRNNGWINATGISATLICSDPYITITSNTSAYPNLAPHASAPSNTPYAISVSSSCPIEHNVQFGLSWTCNEGYADTINFNLIVGNPMYQPMGPDAYGYYAYDTYDENGPQFNWIEIDPAIGGPGTLINYTSDDQTVQVNLPFTFKYYGQNYTQISVCNNGWIAMGSTTETDYTNSAIPNSDGPPAMIAPFWHDLSPQLLGRVAYYYNASQHYFVIEYDSVRHYSPTTARETFEVILYDPAYYPTLTGDGKILFQYNQVSEGASNTVGIENQAETVGLQVLYNGALNNHMGPLQVGTAYLFSTATTAANVAVNLTPYGTPIQIPVSGGSFNYNISVANNGSSPVTTDIWCMVTLPNGSPYGPVLGPVNVTMSVGFSVNRDRTQNVPAGAPAGNYMFRSYVGIYPNVIWDQDSFPFTKLTSGNGAVIKKWINTGESFKN